MTRSQLDALDGERIANNHTPHAVAMDALAAADRDELAPAVQQIHATSAQDHENESHIAAATPYDASNLWAALAAHTLYDPKSAEFDEMAAHLLAHAERNAEHAPDLAVAARAAELGRALARHYSERSLADEIGGDVAKIELEGEAIDVETAEGLAVQVFTCFPKAESTSGKPAKEKMDEADTKHVDRYVVLHANDDGTFGVGVNNLNDGLETDGKHENTVAKNA